MKIVFLGNFNVPFSTESHHAWTWEYMGHQVVKLQEGKATTEQVLAACQDAQVLQLTHTHGWGMPGQLPMEEVLRRVREQGVKTFTYHLDLYWGLNILDRREEKVGQHWSWKLDYVFTTDGSHQAEYESRGVKHYYLPPGVVEYAVFRGGRRNDLASPVGFVGSVGYHPEYRFRQSLIEGLKAHYGNHFRVYGGYREKMLNDLYASIDVVVGDHCFSTNPELQYWSDRLPETTGRGGFMVYPRVKGLDGFIANGLVTYEPGNVDDLYAKIDEWRGKPDERLERTQSLMKYVQREHTYTVRLNQILEIMGLK